MPTGYTAGIEDGRITTGKDFLMLCARAFGACIEMRDEPLSAPIPEAFKPSDYYRTQIAEAEKDIEKYSSLTLDEAQRIIDKEYQHKQKVYAEAIERQKQINQKYESIKNQVKQWQPPTAEHDGLKEFALNQIGMCCDSDASMNIWASDMNEPKASPEEWLKAKLECAREDLERYKKSWQEAINTVSKRNEWLNKLRESLSQI